MRGTDHEPRGSNLLKIGLSNPVVPMIGQRGSRGALVLVLPECPLINDGRVTCNASEYGERVHAALVTCIVEK